MIDKETVIQGLECCSRADCIHCPYWYMDTAKCERLMEDALLFLKVQEPRILEPNEICNFVFEFMWVELKHNEVLKLVEPNEITLLWTIGSWDSYGKLWRCWSAKPTDVQRKAVKWDD